VFACALLMRIGGEQNDGVHETNCVEVERWLRMYGMEHARWSMLRGIEKWRELECSMKSGVRETLGGGDRMTRSVLMNPCCLCVVTVHDRTLHRFACVCSSEHGEVA